MLLPRQAITTPALFGTTTTATTPHASYTALSSTSSSNNEDAKSALWKYAIVVIVAVLALSTLFRLMFLSRMRRLRQMQQHQLGIRVRGNRGNGSSAGAPYPFSSGGGREDRRRFSTTSIDSVHEEVPPPAYDEPVRLEQGLSPPPLAPPVPTTRPSFFSRISSRFKSTPAPASAQNQSGTPPIVSLNSSGGLGPQSQTAEILAEENRTHRWRGDEAIRRALADAGLLATMNRALNRNQGENVRGSNNNSTTGTTETTNTQGDTWRERNRETWERDERRRARRERRRERRRRERERDEGLGLPVYSRRKAEGEEVLQVAEGIKEDDSESEEEGSEASDHERESSTNNSPPRPPMSTLDSNTDQNPSSSSTTPASTDDATRSPTLRSHPLA